MTKKQLLRWSLIIYIVGIFLVFFITTQMIMGVGKMSYTIKEDELICKVGYDENEKVIVNNGKTYYTVVLNCDEELISEEDFEKYIKGNDAIEVKHYKYTVYMKAPFSAVKAKSYVQNNYHYPWEKEDDLAVDMEYLQNSVAKYIGMNYNKIEEEEAVMPYEKLPLFD